MEAALAIATLVGLAVLCAAGITAAALQIRCVDAAREAARLAARGDIASAAVGLAPSGASLEVRREGDYFLARVSGRAPLLPGLVVSGEAVAAAEPDR